MDKIIQHIIFDLDGTIIDSKAEILETYKIVVNEIAPTQTPDLSKINFGATMNDVLKNIYQDETDKIVRAKELFASYYDNSDYLQTSVYDGVITTLEYLKSENIHLYIATNKRYLPTIRILSKKNINHYFSAIMANEMSPGIILSKEQMIEELKIKHDFLSGFMIGDSISDIHAGNKQNLRTIAVSYGYESRHALASEFPTFIIDSFAEIINFFKK